MGDKKIYCGTNKPTKNQRIGSLKECAEKKQIRYYGLKKIDKKTVDNALRKDVIPETREQLLLRLTSLRGLIRRVKGRYETTKDITSKNQYHDEWKKAEKDLLAIMKKFKSIEKVKKVKSKTKKSTKKPKEKNGNTWLNHVQKYYNDHDVSYKQALIDAKKTWKK
jgi:hypothetical protein